MSHTPDDPEQYVCESCQITHVGTPIHEPGTDFAEHDYEPPDACGACGGTSFVRIEEWAHHHE
ncbi:hypothetical protein [Halorhabdus rudnickae]|uniref:hypothetical protein n=1 Tax=Halorhabdus rudnickae TaxID=1775544 RepID=UPI001082AD9C|nr:hypothetical protein [Halorhabdus rudnickae]